ncbi:MAG: hypothetical protein MZV63_43480 [Marinilabiliales bacterium]|nr:hypothetical protein [Marinilabiliales bacterium]
MPQQSQNDMAKYQLETDDISKNFIKLNLTSLAILNFSLQYERVFSRSVSGALSAAYMPENTIPKYIADEAIKQMDENSDEGIDPEAEDIIRNMLISSYSDYSGSQILPREREIQHRILYFTVLQIWQLFIQ